MYRQNRVRIKSFLLLFFKKEALAFLFLFPCLAHAAPFAGSVVAVSGPAVAHNVPLKPGDGVQNGDVVQVGAEGHLQLKMADQSVISVASGSNFRITLYDVAGSDRRVLLSLAQGLLRLTVQQGEGRTIFDVSTANGTASLRSASADWFVAAEPAGVQVGVLTGRVALTGTSGTSSVVVPTHWGTRLEPGRDPVLPRAWAQVEFDGFIQRTACCKAPTSTLPKP